MSRLRLVLCFVLCFFFFFNDTATTEIYTLSLHDALPISQRRPRASHRDPRRPALLPERTAARKALAPPPRNLPRNARAHRDRKSTRLNSSHLVISYAVFCLKKKKKKRQRNESTDKHNTLR